jgi:pyruvate formate lyase activating enzyme
VPEHPALLWEQDGERVSCGLCPNACRIAPGSRGVCGVRRNDDGRLVALTYGLVSSVMADPVEKKPVYHYFPGSKVLSLGSVGCSMRCGHCQNWHISRAGISDVSMQRLEPDRVADIAGRTGCLGVAFTYNEPVIWLEYVLDVAAKCRERGLFTVMVTNGYVTTEGLDAFGEAIGVWCVDIKGSTDEEARRLCSVPSFAPVLAATERARNHWHMHVECVTCVVPTVNDSEETLRDIARWIASALGRDTPWHVTRCVPCLEFSALEPTPVETLARAVGIGHEEGLEFVYVGNVDVPGGEDTVCPACGAVAVKRSGFFVLEQRVERGACMSCGTPLNIVG